MNKEYEGLYDIQKDLITRHFINKANVSNVNLDMGHLARILSEDKVSDRLGYPFLSREADPHLFGERTDRNLPHNTKINVAAFNDTIDTIGNDIHTIGRSINMMERNITNMHRTLGRISPLFDSAKSKVESKYKELRRQMGIVAYSHREDVSDISTFDLDSTTASINVERGLIQTVKASLFEGNINIGIMSQETLIARTADEEPLATDSRFYTLFVPGFDTNTYLSIRKPRREETGAIIEANLQDLRVYANTIVFNTFHKVPTRTTVEIETKGETKVILKDQYLVDSVYTFTFNPLEVDRIIIYMWQNIETAIIGENDFKYDFIINNISLEYTSFNDDSIFIAQPINVPFAITDVMMEAADNRPVGTDIKYFISKDKQRWIPITPRNIRPNAPNSVVSLSLSSLETLEGIGDDVTWSIVAPNNTYGPVALYNILENATHPYIDGTNALTIYTDPDDEIIEDSIKLYRGYDDWSIEEQNYEKTQEYSAVEYRFPPYDAPSGAPTTDDYTYDQISMLSFVRIDNEAHIIVLGPGGERQIKTNYPIHNNNIEIIDTKLNKKVQLQNIDTPIDYATGTVTLNENDAIVKNEVLVTYHVAIQNIEEKDDVEIKIDPLSIRYKDTADPTEEEVQGAEVYYSTYDKLMHLRRDNSLYVNNEDWTSVFISFKTTTKSKDTYKVFKTYVYYNTDTEITILPFTQEEITAGNRHIIDGVDISSLKTYTMTGGLHEIITTQPYKSDPDNAKDKNTLTNKQSKAGVILGNYTERRAYKNPMRMVSSYVLGNIIPPGDHRSFVYKDGQMLINFIPEELPENALLLASHLTGTDILCKEATYLEDGKYTFLEYVEKKEKFTIEYKTRPKAGTANDIRTLYVKGDLFPNKKLGISPSIFQYDILFL